VEIIAQYGSVFIVIAIVFGLFMTWGIGANDVANVMGTSVGSGAITVMTAIIIAAIFEFGGAAGLLAGGMTSSPTLAAAQEALRAGQIQVPDGMTVDQVMTNVTTAYAITYIFGLVGLILIIRMLPKIAGVDFKAEAARLAGE